MSGKRAGERGACAIRAIASVAICVCAALACGIPAASAQSVDVKVLVGLDRRSNESGGAHAGLGGRQDDTPSASERGQSRPSIVELIEIDRLPSTWLIRDESGRLHLMCASGREAPRSSSNEPVSGPSFLLR
jgi:hypothetical protein